MLSQRHSEVSNGKWVWPYISEMSVFGRLGQGGGKLRLCRETSFQKQNKESNGEFSEKS